MYTLSPAYGRRYLSKPAVIEAWTNGADFMIAAGCPGSGRYASIRDFKKDELVALRFGKFNEKELTVRGSK